MLKNVMNVKVNYTYLDNSKDKNIVLLHGWGQNIEMMEPLANKFKDNYNILNIDLPGHGKSTEPGYPWDIYEYSKCVNTIISDLGLKNIVIIGHSFGGRVGIVYASMYDTLALVLLASPYCKELSELPLKSKIYKKIKNIHGLKWLLNIMKKHIGSTDYKNASEVMRGVLVKAINLDLSENAKKIKSPTLLIWGSNDSAVPLNRAHELNKLISNSKLKVYEGASHYAYLEHIDDVSKNIIDFIKGV